MKILKKILIPLTILIVVYGIIILLGLFARWVNKPAKTLSPTEVIESAIDDELELREWPD